MQFTACLSYITSQQHNWLLIINDKINEIVSYFRQCIIRVIKTAKLAVLKWAKLLARIKFFEEEDENWASIFVTLKAFSKNPETLSEARMVNDRLGYNFLP